MNAVREFCEVSAEDAVLTVRLRRPECLNALHPPASLELEEVFDAFEADPTLRVAIVTGSGDRAFCVGADLKYWAEHGRTPMPASGFAGLTHRRAMRKPLIAAVNGLAMGGGFELALACDVIVAATHAEFALPEPRVGTAATAGGVQRLAAQVPQKAALSMILTGRRVPADQLLQWGLIAEVTEPSALMSAARRWADAIVACAPLAIAASKALVEAVTPARIPPRIEELPPEVVAMWHSEDNREGPRAFAQKRPPVWQGR